MIYLSEVRYREIVDPSFDLHRVVISPRSTRIVLFYVLRMRRIHFESSEVGPISSSTPYHVSVQVPTLSALLPCIVSQSSGMMVWSVWVDSGPEKTRY